MKLTDIKTIKRLMEENGITFQKKFGQNFLINETVPQRIASYATENVLEIGPGIGVLTRELSYTCKKVAAVEIDNGLINILRKTLGDRQNITVIHADILKCNLPRLVFELFEGEPVSVCANLPYNITTPVIMMLLSGGVRFLSLTVLVQKEACDRFCAESGSPEYGAMTAVASYYAKSERLFHVSAGSFIPKPKVESTVMRFLPYEKSPVDVKDPDFMIEVIHAAFNQRRKTLCNALSSGFTELSKQMISDAIASCGFEPDIRGERLNINDFASLTNKLCILIKR